MHTLLLLLLLMISTPGRSSMCLNIDFDLFSDCFYPYDFIISIDDNGYSEHYATLYSDDYDLIPMWSLDALISDGCQVNYFRLIGSCLGRDIDDTLWCDSDSIIYRHGPYPPQSAMFSLFNYPHCFFYPLKILISIEGGNIVLNWNGDDNTDGIRWDIYRSIDPEAIVREENYLATVDAEQFVDINVLATSASLYYCVMQRVDTLQPCW